jgi:hypothetical protein
MHTEGTYTRIGRVVPFKRYHGTMLDAALPWYNFNLAY